MIRLFKIYLTLAFLLVTTFCMAQKSELKFSKDGKFKIVQFTDVHFKYGNRASDIALERINQVLDDERPDLVIFTHQQKNLGRCAKRRRHSRCEPSHGQGQ